MQNDMRDRLVEQIEYLRKVFMEDDDYDDLSYFLADHLIANGVIVPPCKVGDKIYTISIYREIEEYVVAGICLYPNGWFVEFYYEDKPYSIHIDDVFLTKEEAEQKLKELNENA